jgi:alginate O-acetyltransferase complex protein AlgI
LGVSRPELLFAVFVIGIMMLRERFLPGHLIKNNKQFFAYTIMMVVLCYFFGVFSENQFIYFQF